MMVMDEWTARVYTFSAERLTVNAPFNFKKYSITPLPTPQYKTGRLLIKNKNSNKTQQIPTKQQKKSTTSSKKKRFLEHLEMKKKSLNKIWEESIGREKKRGERRRRNGEERLWRAEYGVRQCEHTWHCCPSSTTAFNSQLFAIRAVDW